MDHQAIIASLESQIDYLKTELTNLNTLLIENGFPDGIITLKKALIEVAEEENMLK